MKIAEIAAYDVRLDLVQPFVTALGRLDVLETVIVRVADDHGNEGWGEAVPKPRIVGETSGSIRAALGLIAERLRGEDPRRIDRIVRLMDEAIDRNTAAKAGVDIAIHDLLGKYWNEPVWRLLGGARCERLSTDMTVGLQDVDSSVAQARAWVEKGFQTLKVKVGGAPHEEAQRVRAIRDAVGDDATIRLDANQAWSAPEAIRALKLLMDCEVEFVEQPVPALDIAGLKRVRQATDIPVMADESVHGPEDALRIVRESAADYLNIKLTKSGGFFKARRIAAIADAAGLPCMVGGMFESDLAATAAVHLAAATGNVEFRDLDQGIVGLSLREGIISEGGTHLDGNCRTVPMDAGLGVARLNEAVLGDPSARFA